MINQIFAGSLKSSEESGETKIKPVLCALMIFCQIMQKKHILAIVNVS